MTPRKPKGSDAATRQSANARGAWSVGAPKKKPLKLDASLSPTLAKAFTLLFASQVREQLANARSLVRDAEINAEYYAGWLAKTGNDEVWGDDARRSKRELAADRKNLAFWRKAASELKGD